MITALDGPVLLHNDYTLLTAIMLAPPDAVFQDKPNVEFGIVLFPDRKSSSRNAAHIPFSRGKSFDTRIVLTRRLRWLVEKGTGYGLALEGISAAEVARSVPSHL